MKKVKKSEFRVIRGDESQEQPTLKLLGETIIVGPGTVPTSAASISQTSIKDVVSGAKRASRLGLFDTQIPLVNE